MNKEQWVAIKKEEYKNDRSRHSFKELGIEDRIEYDKSRAEENPQNSGYFIRSKRTGRECDIGEAAMAVGYIYLSSAYEGDTLADRLEARLEKGGRLDVGDKGWRSTEI